MNKLVCYHVTLTAKSVPTLESVIYYMNSVYIVNTCTWPALIKYAVYFFAAPLSLASLQKFGSNNFSSPFQSFKQVLT